MSAPGAEAGHRPPLHLRPYQQEAIAAVERELLAAPSTLLVSPTGTGKTEIFCAVADRLRHHGRILILADRKKLVRQTAQRIVRSTGLVAGIEMGDENVDPLFMPDVVCASVQSMSRETRLRRFDSGAFALIIIDEADLAVAPTYGAVLKHFSGARVLGVTATPDRSDGKPLRERFATVAYVYELRDAIEQGFLSPIRQMSVAIETLDLSSCRTTAGDLNEGDLAEIMMEERNLHGVVRPALDLAGDRPTIVFASGVRHAKALAALFNRYRPGCADSVDGGMDADEEIEPVLDRFAKGQFQFLCNCALLIRGVDIPPIACVAMARPTKSRALYVQAVGRGTRLSPATGKKDLLVLDFEGNAGRHSLINALDILDGNADAQVRERAKRILKKDPDRTVLEALDLAAHELAAEKRKKVLAEARYRAVEVDPFTAVETILGVRPRAGRWAGAAATPGQRDLLKNNGIDLPALDKGQAHDVIDAIMGRRQAGLCTFKQAKILLRFGLDPTVTFEVARQQLDLIARNNWRLPAELEAGAAR